MTLLTIIPTPMPVTPEALGPTILRTDVKVGPNIPLTMTHLTKPYLCQKMWAAAVTKLLPVVDRPVFYIAQWQQTGPDGASST